MYSLHRLRKKHLNTKYIILSPSEYVKLWLLDNLPPKAVLLTFDDGYNDNWMNAVPILEMNNASAVFFVCSSMLGKNGFWWDRLANIYRQTLNLPQDDFWSKIEQAPNIHHRQNILGLNSQMEIILMINHYLRLTYSDQIDEYLLVLEQLFDISTIGNEYNKLMTSASISRLADNSLFCIGAHSTKHICAAILDSYANYEDLVRDKSVLETTLKSEINY